MKILHYFLGFPPYRSGGLTKYCYDLMTEQVKRGDTVTALWPGKMDLLGNKVKIRNRKDIEGIHNYEIINPVPVPLDEGIIDTSLFMQQGDTKVFFAFLKKIEPNVVHIHTLMGLHHGFFDAMKSLNIYSVFTTHDYFGICSKVTLYRKKAACETSGCCEDCYSCNQSALSITKIKILQSPLYRYLKDIKPIRILRANYRYKFFWNDAKGEDDLPNVKGHAREYIELRKYYMGMLESISLIQYNSSVAADLFHKFVSPQRECILSISHKDIEDRRKMYAKKNSNMLRITYLSSVKPYKGFEVLQKALDRYWEENKGKFVLTVYGPVNFSLPYMQVKKKGFKQSELPEIMSNTDIVIVPSVWYETFGFTVLEALSYGVPVIVSDHVGAKDIIGKAGIIVKAGSSEQLYDAINSLFKDGLEDLNNEIQKISIKCWKEFVNENYKLYKKEG